MQLAERFVLVLACHKHGVARFAQGGIAAQTVKNRDIHTHRHILAPVVAELFLETLRVAVYIVGVDTRLHVDVGHHRPDPHLVVQLRRPETVFGLQSQRIGGLGAVKNRFGIGFGRHQRDFGQGRVEFQRAVQRKVHDLLEREQGRPIEVLLAGQVVIVGRHLTFELGDIRLAAQSQFFLAPHFKQIALALGQLQGRQARRFAIIHRIGKGLHGVHRRLVLEPLYLVPAHLQVGGSQHPLLYVTSAAKQRKRGGKPVGIIKRLHVVVGVRHRVDRTPEIILRAHRTAHGGKERGYRLIAFRLIGGRFVALFPHRIRVFGSKAHTVVQGPYRKGIVVRHKRGRSEASRYPK